MQKVELRKFIKGLKSTLSIEEKLEEAKTVFNIVASLPAFCESKSILLYHSLPDELPTHSIIDEWDLCKKIFLPRVNGDFLDIVKYDNNGMKSSCRFGIMEPTSNTVYSVDEIDIIIVPGVAFDSKCNRLGRGKGFYDKLLSNANALKIGVALDCQIVESLETDSYDIPMDMVITKSHVFTR